MDIIGVRRLDAGYDGDPILRGLDFTIAAGRTTVIVGESGSWGFPIVCWFSIK